MELESFRDEYANAQLECSAADERAKILASEVIGLEEKVICLHVKFKFVISLFPLYNKKEIVFVLLNNIHLMTALQND